MDITDLRPEHVEDAARLVTTGYRTLRGQVPSLPAAYEDPRTVADMLDGLGENAGIVALQAGRLVGFLAGLVLPEFMGKRSFYSPEWAHGAEQEGSRRIYTDMYRHASARWIEDGCPLHVVTLMTHDRAGLEAWRWLGFGLVNVDGMRDLARVPGGPAGLDVRQARPEDAAVVNSLGRAMEEHMASAPVFWIHDAEDYAAWLQQPDYAVWLAYEDGEAVGCLALGLGHASGCDMVQDEKTVGIVMAYAKPSLRRRGISTALVNGALAWARARGYQRCAADWEAMNPPANDFWTKRFDPVCYSLMRWIDERAVPRSPG